MKSFSLPMNSRKPNRKGFTLAEVMIAATISLMGVTSTLGAFLSINRSTYALSVAINLNAKSRLAQDRVVYDIRSITELSTVNEQVMTGKFIDFTKDVSAPQTISYKLADGKLTREVTDGAGTVTTKVLMEGLVTTTGPSLYSKFVYLNKAGVVTTSAAEARAIQIQFIPAASNLQKKGLVPGSNDRFTSSVVELRNKLK